MAKKKKEIKRSTSIRITDSDRKLVKKKYRSIQAFLDLMVERLKEK